MSCFCDVHTLGTYERSERGVLETNLLQEFNHDTPNEIRGKFAGVLVWSPIQSVGHLGLRLYNLFSGASFTIGREKAYASYYANLKDNPKLRGRAIEGWRIPLYQLRQLIIDVCMLAAYIIIAIPAKELIALSGLVMPLDARVAYGALERFFLSRPKDALNSHPTWFEFFTFSAPCMQALDEKSSLFKRRCEVNCAPEHRRYQPKSTLAKVHILKDKIRFYSKYFLKDADKEILNAIADRIKKTRCKSPVTITRELSLIEGRTASNNDEEAILILNRVTVAACEKLDEALKAWTEGEELDFKEFYEDVQKTLSPIDSIRVEQQ